MPANLTPQYHDAEERYKGASSDPERISALEEMLRVIPKHKGTEKMQADLKSRLAKLRKASQKKGPTTSSQKPFYQVDREGAGQIVLFGPPNSGKSRLVATLTNASPEVADYPFTTRAPLPGMMPYQDIQIQLVDSVPLAPHSLEPWQLALVANADAGVLMFDVTDSELLDQTDFVLDVLVRKNLSPRVSATPPILVLGNKVDLSGAADEFQVWQDLYQGRFQAEPFSVLSEADLLNLKPRLFRMLDVVRVYSKAPGKRVEEDASPFVLKSGSTILDVAATIHKDLAVNFKFAKVWNSEMDGLMVERSYPVRDGDLAEIHA